MITKILSSEEYKRIIGEVFLNNNDDVTKISDTSVINSLFFGYAKTIQKTTKDVALIEAQIFSESANGSELDEIALRRGVISRFGSLGSSTYVRLIADVGTIYNAGTQQFTGNDGITFDLEEDITIGDNGFAYAKISSVEIGERTNVDPLSINQIINPPVGHQFVTNEYRATGGRDQEDDDLFRDRIQKSLNLLAQETLEKLKLVFNKINPKVLRVINRGVGNSGKIVLSVLSVNGSDFTPAEFDEILSQGKKYLNLVDSNIYGKDNVVGVDLVNQEFEEIDISFRADFDGSFDIDEVRVNIQTEIAKYFDYRFWSFGQKVEWDDLLQIVKETPGVSYVYDNFFSPQVDVIVPINKIPRVRGFLMLDRDGNIVSTDDNELNPIFYPVINDFDFVETTLNNI